MSRILHKNAHYWRKKCKGSRATECGEKIDDKLTTDDWDKVRCRACLAARWIHMRDGLEYMHSISPFACCGKRAPNKKATRKWPEVTCPECLKDKPEE